MTRSEINEIMRASQAFLQRMHFLLPPFAAWSPRTWARKGSECRGIVEQQLGWDITDFGSGDFAKVGLFLFTIRNGTLAAASHGGKSYAEKILIVQERQVTPIHFHYQKMEDIINRGGGNLLIQVWNATKTERLATTDVVLNLDGVTKRFAAGAIVRLRPGDSVTLPQRNYHQFWGEAGKGTVLVGEVSRVNDDRTDNRFFGKVGRFPAIDEDASPLHLLYNDYAKYYRYA